jgi:hypothetical protein
MIILLVVLALIFLITVGMGGCHHGGRTPNDAGAVKSLKGLQGNRFLTIGDKAFVSPGSCWDARAPQVLTVTINTDCFVTFQKRAFFRKSTRVALQSNRPLTVTIDPVDGPRREDPVGAGDCFGSAVSHSGGSMTLESPTGTATVLLLRHACPG